MAVRVYNTHPRRNAASLVIASIASQKRIFTRLQLNIGKSVTTEIRVVGRTSKNISDVGNRTAHKSNWQVIRIKVWCTLWNIYYAEGTAAQWTLLCAFLHTFEFHLPFELKVKCQIAHILQKASWPFFFEINPYWIIGGRTVWIYLVYAYIHTITTWITIWNLKLDALKKLYTIYQIYKSMIKILIRLHRF